MRAWRPILAGATAHDRLVACAGAFAGIALTALICSLLQGSPGLVLVAPMGASAVLLFAVPASPLSQPWPIVGGHVVAVLVGCAAAEGFGTGSLGAGAAVSLAILFMSLLRCLHPPGGGTALLPLLNVTATGGHGYSALVAMVALNALALIAAGWLFHRVSGHSYPHRSGTAPNPSPGRNFLSEDIDSALAELGETFDVSREDLEQLLQLAQQHAEQRRVTRKS